jgi:hypothetical protein
VAGRKTTTSAWPYQELFQLKVASTRMLVASRWLRVSHPGSRAPIKAFASLDLSKPPETPIEENVHLRMRMDKGQHESLLELGGKMFEKADAAPPIGAPPVKSGEKEEKSGSKAAAILNAQGFSFEQVVKGDLADMVGFARSAASS